MTMITAVSCSDDSTSGEMDEPPSLPTELMPATVDFTYFESQSVPDEPENSVYKQVESVAYTGGSVVQSGGMVNLASSFIELAPMMGVEPKQENGSWVWEFTDLPPQFSKSMDLASEEVPFSNQESISLKIVATPVTGGVEWEVYYSGELGDETTVSDFRLMTGFTSDDGNGEWLFYLPDSGDTPIYKYEYNFVDENEYVASYEIFFDGDTFNVEYERNAPENRISIIGGEHDVIAFWNENTDSGWIEEDGVRQCFSNFENTSC